MIEIKKNGELMVAQVEGVTDAGVSFVDGWIPDRTGASYEVVDAGRIIVESVDVDALVASAKERGLDVSYV